MELTIDKEFEELCPPLSAEELRLLEEGILADGCLDPIITWANHNDTLIDGHNRYQICTKHGLPFKTKALKLDTRIDAKAWIIRNQCGRRNLSESQRAMLAAKLATLGQGEGKPANLPVSTQAEAAADFGVSERTVRSARKVIESGTKALQHAVEDGSVAVSAAAAVAELPKAEQRKVVKAGPKAVAEKAKEIKADKAAVKQYADSFDTATLDKESAADKKKQGKVAGFDDAKMDAAVKAVVKGIDAAYDGLVTLCEDRWAFNAKDSQGYERAKRAVEQNRRKAHDAINGVLTSFNLWRGK